MLVGNWYTATWHLLERSWVDMVAATGTSSLGLAVWTLGLAIAGWLAKRLANYLKTRRNLGNREAIKKAFEGGLIDAAIEGISILAVAVVAWAAFVPVVVYRDHQSLVIANRQLEIDLKEKRKPVAESPNSLRRRTIRVTDDIVAFWDRLGPQPFFNPTTDEQRQKDTAWSDKATRAYRAAGFKERILGIVEGYKMKGANIGFLETEAEQQPQRMWGAFPEPECSPQSPSEVCQLRELAYHVDAQDNLIVVKPD